MSRKLDFSAPLPISLDTTILHDELKAFDTIQVIKTNANNQVYYAKDLFHTSETLVEGDIFSGKIVKKDGSTVRFTIKNPCHLRFTTHFEAINNGNIHFNPGALDCDEVLEESDEDDITYEVVTPPRPTVPALPIAPIRNPLKRTYGKLGESSIFEDDEDKLVNFRPSKIQKMQ